MEHFTNDASPPSEQADEYLDNLYANSFDFNNRDSSDFIKLQYHIANPGFDQINADNPDDPSARRIYYTVSQLDENDGTAKESSIYQITINEKIPVLVVKSDKRIDEWTYSQVHTRYLFFEVR